MTKDQRSRELDQVRVMNIVTSSLSLRFLDGQAEYFREQGYEVVMASSPGEELNGAQRDGVRAVAMRMAREISPWADCVSLWWLIRAIWLVRPAITNVATPKAGLLGGIAAWVCGVPCRYYTLHGLRCETTTGLKRKLLLLTERIACGCADRVICVSESLRQRAIELGIVAANRTVVLASGSCNGVDAERFAATDEALRSACRIRQELGIPAEAPVIGFVGRLTKDKGIRELAEAYLSLRADISELRLLLVGEMEDGDPLPAQIRNLIENDWGIVRTGFVQDPFYYHHAMDVLALPTYREGFPTVVLEAHAAGKPVVATRATGAVNAVIDGVTGILVPVGDAPALARALALVIRDRELAAALGAAGRERVLREFRRERVWDAIAQEYLQLLRAKGLAAPRSAERNENTALAAGAVASR
jgi:glycosyltransferase involved in cell wall biosynthesis